MIYYKWTPLSDQFLQVDFVLWPTLPALSLLLFPNISLKISKGKRNLVEKVAESVWPEWMWYSELLIHRCGRKEESFQNFHNWWGNENRNSKETAKRIAIWGSKEMKKLQILAFFLKSSRRINNIEITHSGRKKKSESYNQNHMIDL